MDTLNSPVYKRIAAWCLIHALIWGPLVSANANAGADDLSETVQYLLDFVKTSECRFYRNNTEHTAKEAVEHMKRKYAYFRDKIKTPEDFIRLTATRSTISGKRYYVILRDGKRITSEAWLLQALETYRQQQK